MDPILIFALIVLAALIVVAVARGATSAPPRSEVPKKVRDTPSQPASHFVKAKVVRVIDGDTIVAEKADRKVLVRLDSIDCPENGQHWGDTAKYGLIKLVGGRHVHLEEHGIDRYGRTLATIHVEGGEDARWINVNERMITLGHAWVMRKFYTHLPRDRQAQLNRLERWARSKKVGLWKSANPIPPWKWRRDD